MIFNTKTQEVFKIAGPNPAMFDQYLSLDWNNGTWINADRFGVPDKVRPSEWDRRFDLRSQIEEIAHESTDIPDSEWGKPVRPKPEEEIVPKRTNTGRARVPEEEIEDKSANNPIDPEDEDGFIMMNEGDEEEEDEMIRNTDGTPYNPDDQKMGQFDPDSPEHELMDEIDQEVIDLGGAPIEYYRVLVDGNVDEFYGEQMEKRFAQKLYRMIAQWEPVQPEWNWISGGAGFGSDELMTFNFNRRTFLETVGEMPRIGSLIKTCTDGVFWEITRVDVNVEGEDRKLWGKHRVAVLTQKYQATITDPSPSGLGRESYRQGKEGGITIR